MHPQAPVTCFDDGRLRLGAQHPLVVELTLVIHVVLELPQGLRGFEQLPVLVVWEMVLDEQCRVGEEVEFVVAGGGTAGQKPCCAMQRGRRGPQGIFGAFFKVRHGGSYPQPNRKRHHLQP